MLEAHLGGDVLHATFGERVGSTLELHVPAHRPSSCKGALGEQTRQPQRHLTYATRLRTHAVPRYTYVCGMYLETLTPAPTPFGLPNPLPCGPAGLDLSVMLQLSQSPDPQHHEQAAQMAGELAVHVRQFAGSVRLVYSGRTARPAIVSMTPQSSWQQYEEQLRGLMGDDFVDG